MNDSNEPLEEKVKRLEAETVTLRKQLADVTTDRDKYKDYFQMLAYDQSVKAWEGITQEDLDAAMKNTGVLDRVIEQLEREGRSV